MAKDEESIVTKIPDDPEISMTEDDVDGVGTMMPDDPELSRIMNIVAGLDKSLDAPQLCLVAPQSSGKSQFISTLAGAPIGFSRDTVGTRCPVRYFFKRSRTSADGDPGPTSFKVAGHSCDSLQDLSEAVESHMQGLEQNEPSKQFSVEFLDVCITMPSVVDTTIIDTPGIPNKTATHYKMVKKLLQKLFYKNPALVPIFISKANTVDDQSNMSADAVDEVLAEENETYYAVRKDWRQESVEIWNFVNSVFNFFGSAESASAYFEDPRQPLFLCLRGLSGEEKPPDLVRDNFEKQWFRQGMDRLRADLSYDVPNSTQERFGVRAAARSINKRLKAAFRDQIDRIVSEINSEIELKTTEIQEVTEILEAADVEKAREAYIRYVSEYIDCIKAMLDGTTRSPTGNHENQTVMLDIEDERACHTFMSEWMSVPNNRRQNVGVIQPNTLLGLLQLPCYDDASVASTQEMSEQDDSESLQDDGDKRTSPSKRSTWMRGRKKKPRYRRPKAKSPPAHGSPEDAPSKAKGPSVHGVPEDAPPPTGIVLGPSVHGGVPEDILPPTGFVRSLEMKLTGVASLRRLLTYMTLLINELKMHELGEETITNVGSSNNAQQSVADCVGVAIKKSLNGVRSLLPWFQAHFFAILNLMVDHVRVVVSTHPSHRSIATHSGFLTHVDENTKKVFREETKKLEDWHSATVDSYHAEVQVDLPYKMLLMIGSISFLEPDAAGNELTGILDKRRDRSKKQIEALIGARNGGRAGFTDQMDWIEGGFVTLPPMPQAGGSTQTVNRATTMHWEATKFMLVHNLQQQTMQVYSKLSSKYVEALSTVRGNIENMKDDQIKQWSPLTPEVREEKETRKKTLEQEIESLKETLAEIEAWKTRIAFET